MSGQAQPDTDVRVLAERLRFYLEQRVPDHHTLVSRDGGCRPATPEEVSLWIGYLAAESGRAALREERRALIQHVRHYLTEWGTPHGDDNERSWLVGAVNHLGSALETLRLVSDDRDAAESDRAALRARVEALEAALREAIPVMRAYAATNPRHIYQGVPQDPNGVHAWLAAHDAALAGPDGEALPPECSICRRRDCRRDHPCE